MNYGLGGRIRVHTDVEESLLPWQDDLLHGGPRLLTYMVAKHQYKQSLLAEV